jgi:hypothetical protein
VYDKRIHQLEAELHEARRDQALQADEVPDYYFSVITLYLFFLL